MVTSQYGQNKITHNSSHFKPIKRLSLTCSEGENETKFERQRNQELQCTHIITTSYPCFKTRSFTTHNTRGCSKLYSRPQRHPPVHLKDCYKTRSCLDLKKQKERRKEEKKKNRSYHFEFSSQNEKLVVHASAPRRTSVCDKLTKKKIH